MLYARLIVGIALILIAALGPRFGLRGLMTPRVGKEHTGHDHVDQRRATVLILRILAAMLGLWLIFFSTVELLHGHGHLNPGVIHIYVRSTFFILLH